MPIVTSLKPQKNNKRVNVYVDNKFAFGIDLDNLVRFNIRVDQEFSGEQLNKIIYEAEFQKTFDKLVNFSMFRPRSEREVFNWLKRKKVHKSMNENLLKRLKKLELIDDLKFTKWWIEQRIQFKSKSKKALIFELRAKGIEKELIDKVLSEEVIDEKKLAMQLLEKKAYKWQKFDEQERKKKMSEFLARNGFDWDTIKAALDSFDPK